MVLVEELEFLRRYLEIQQVCIQERMHVSVDAAPDTLDAMVPNLVLQPLVEKPCPLVGGGKGASPTPAGILNETARSVVP